MFRCKLASDSWEHTEIIEHERSDSALINFDSTPEHPWEISRLPFMTQRNGYDCGPIACAKIMDYYGMWPQNNKPPGGLRKFVVNTYKQMMLSFGENMFVRVPVHTINLLDSCDDNSAAAVASDDSTSATQKDLEKCMICLSRIQKDSTGMVLNCCGKSIHGLCVAGWLQHQDTCPYCRKIVDEIEVDGHKIPFGNAAAAAVSIPTKSNNIQPTAKTPLSGEFDLETKLDSEVSSDDDDDVGSGDGDDVDSRGGDRRAAIRTKRTRQKNQALKMKKRRLKYCSATGAKVGAVVRIGNDFRDVAEPRSALGVIMDIKGGGGIKVLLGGGILCHGSKKQQFWVPAERYEVLKDGEMHLSPALVQARSEIMLGTFDTNSHKKTTLQKDHQEFTGRMSRGRTNGCKCGLHTGKKECSNNCMCIRNKWACTSSCNCMGNCTKNAYNGA